MPEISSRPSFSKAFRLVLTLLRSSKQSINPKKFLAELGTLISQRSHRTFSPNKEHDVPEVLSYVLDSLIGTSAILRKMISSTYCVRLTCNDCNSERTTEQDPLAIIAVPVKENIQCAINSFHCSEVLEGTSAIHCDMCGRKTSTLRDLWFSDLPEIVFIQLNRFFMDGNTPRKNLRQVAYGDLVNLPLMLDQEVMVPTQCPYTLRAVINHTGPFGNGHYTANVKYKDSNNWIHCNDNAVCFMGKESSRKKFMDPKTPYLFVFSRS